MTHSSTGPFHLVRTPERADEIDAVAALLGERVGLAGVLADLNRRARPGRVPGLATRWGFRWDEEDQRSVRWWPQGISTSSDAQPSGTVDGREVVVTSAYSKKIRGQSRGSRLTFVDVTDRTAVRYRHVLLVEPYVEPDGRVDVRPLNVHAGGVVWHGDHVHVAGTRRGIVSFHLDDLLHVRGGDPDRIGVDAESGDGTVHSFGYRYVLPARTGYEAVTAEGSEPMRYSFLSLDTSHDRYALVAGEYGRRSMTTRLVRYEIDPATSLLTADPAGTTRPVVIRERGLVQTQGAVCAEGRWYLTTSHGRHVPGSVWSGTTDDLRRHRFATPAGPEDITYWRGTDQLWSLSEHPGKRFVFAMDRSTFD